MEACAYCGKKERVTDKVLVAPCDCYKKHEAGRYHQQCLQQYLVESAHVPEDIGKQTCPRCGVEYRVKVAHRFVCDWRHVCTASAVGKLFELLAVAVTVVVTIGIFALIDVQVRLV